MVFPWYAGGYAGGEPGGGNWGVAGREGSGEGKVKPLLLRGLGNQTGGRGVAPWYAVGVPRGVPAGRPAGRAQGKRGGAPPAASRGEGTGIERVLSPLCVSVVWYKTGCQR